MMVNGAFDSTSLEMMRSMQCFVTTIEYYLWKERSEEG